MTEPTVLVAVPILAGVFPLLLGRLREGVGWSVAAATMAVQTALAVRAAVIVFRDGPIRTQVGAIPEPFAITLVVDELSVGFVTLTAVAGLGVLAYTRTAGPRSGPVSSLYLLLVAGITGICVTADVFNLYVFLEISGLTAYALVASRDGGPAAVAALNYLLVGTVGASLYLLGVGYAYVATGTLDMATLGERVVAADGGGTLLVTAFALMAVGLGVKAALYPLHTWKPDAYATAPTGITALLSALVSTVAAYALVRLLLVAFTVEFLLANPVVEAALVAVGVGSVLAGSLLAFRASEVTRLLAYSSVAQFGVVTVGIAVASATALSGAVVQLLGHAVMKGGLFLAAGVVAVRFGVERVDGYDGLAREAPLTAAVVATLALGLIGIPPTVGFAGKFYVALGAVQAGSWVAAGVVVASTVLSLAYLGPLVGRMYVGRGDHTRRNERSVGRVAAPVAAALLTVLLGLAAGAFVESLAPALDGVGVVQDTSGIRDVVAVQDVAVVREVIA